MSNATYNTQRRKKASKGFGRLIFATTLFMMLAFASQQEAKAITISCSPCGSASLTFHIHGTLPDTPTYLQFIPNYTLQVEHLGELSGYVLQFTLSSSLGMNYDHTASVGTHHNFFDYSQLLISNTVRDVTMSILVPYVNGRIVSASMTVILPDGLYVTPVPAALPLFATGLAGLGFITYRRKRKRAA